MRLGKMVKAYRVLNDLPLRPLAKFIGISPATLCRIERGQPMSGDALAKIIRWATFPDKVQRR